MVNIISKNGMFFKEIPFTLENAKAIQNGSKRGYCVLDNGVCTHDVRIIATDIKNEECPIVVAVDCGNESVVSVTECGTSAMNGSLRLYVPTRINTYENFIPSLYQACLIRESGKGKSRWTIEVCSGYHDEKKPTFFGKLSSINWECVPLCKATVPLVCGTGCTISWKQYITNLLSHDEN